VPALSIEMIEAHPEATARVWRGRLALLFAVILATSVGAFLLALVSYVWPIGRGDFPTFAELSQHRSYVWAFFLVAGIQLVVGVCAAAIVGLVLTPARGSRLGTAGAALLFLGAAAYGVGIGGWATVYWFGTESTALDPAAATRLIHVANHDAAHMLVIPITGAVIVGLGSLVLSAGIWRAATLPRTVIIASALSTIATVVLRPDTFFGLSAEFVSSLTTIAFGWYALQMIVRPLRESQPRLRGSVGALHARHAVAGVEGRSRHASSV
jgi:hypothetical protein